MKRNEDRLIQENKKLKEENEILKGKINSLDIDNEILKNQCKGTEKVIDAEARKRELLSRQYEELRILFVREQSLVDKLLELLELKMKGKG